jgi:amino acid adenylation domain-containing protein
VPDILSILLAGAAQERPNHPAVEDGRTTLTYRQLSERAQTVAMALARCGVRPGDRVGILLPKSCDAVCAIYGILYAGAAYVPLDVGVPVARIAYMVGNCGMRVLLSDSRQAARVAPELSQTPLAHLLLLGGGEVPAYPAGAWQTGRVSWTNPAASGTAPVPRGPDDLAYILYTSGSTGQPKGVMISHRNALAFVEWSKQAVGVGSGDRLSSHAPFHFDLSIFDLYVASLARATLVLLPGGLVVFPSRVAEWIEQQRISVWYSVPSALVQMLDAGRTERFAYAVLRKVIFAGEVFASKYLRAWMENLPRADFYNLYGPTETNVCTWYPVLKPPAEDTPIPIGRSASDAVLWLRDEDGTVIKEPGRVGELWVEGPTVALGYWGDEVKTRERFVHDPAVTKGKLYRTGDLACWNNDGDLIFRGRRDHMVKSRGYRIELGEIEAALNGHPDLEEVVALPVPHVEWGTAIVACVVPRQGAATDEATIKAYLGERLPRYMVPAAVHLLEQLPHTSTGKIDRQQLLATVGQQALPG